MRSNHKQKRNNIREKWLLYKGLESNGINFDKPKNYHDLKKYTFRKRKNFKKLNDKLGRKGHEHLEGHNRNIIHLEKNIDFEENIENIVKLTQDVRSHIRKYLTLHFSIDHKRIDNISVAGLLYLVGQISKITEARFHDGNHHVVFNNDHGLKNDMRIRYLFDQIGYWKYFGIYNTPYKIDNSIKENYFLSIQTSTKSEMGLLNKIKAFINENVNFMQDKYELEYQFDDTIKEAMGNSIEHAYPDTFNELGKQKGKWWICGHYDKKNNSIELVFYDYGVGIRESIKYNLGEKADRELFDRISDAYKNDADLIEMAINGELSKYKNYSDHDRGKGFMRFKEFAKASDFDCELTVVSNAGKYKMSYNAQTKIESVKKSKLSGDIDGMLIKWKIDLKKGGGDE